MSENQITKREFLKLIASGATAILGLEFLLSCSKEEEFTPEEIEKACERYNPDGCIKVEDGISEREDKIYKKIFKKDNIKQIEKNEKLIRHILMTISTGEAWYVSKHGKYASLEELAKKNYISEEIASGNIKGYKIIQVKLEGCSDFAFKAIPIKQGTTGIRSFYIDGIGVIYKSNSMELDTKGEIDPDAPRPRGM